MTNQPCHSQAAFYNKNTESLLDCENILLLYHAPLKNITHCINQRRYKSYVHLIGIQLNSVELTSSCKSHSLLVNCVMTCSTILFSGPDFIDGLEELIREYGCIPQLIYFLKVNRPCE